MNDIVLRPIGVIHSPHTTPEKTPIQPAFASGIAGTIEVEPAYEEGLADLEGFSHIWVLFAFDRAGEVKLKVKPFLDDTPRGVFATRAPRRPNPIGLSLLRLVRREGRVLHVEDVDILDATPLLDIKPYSGRFDVREGARCGWLDKVDEESARRLGRRGFEG
ncbi:MAG: tRNA (N6-threonylcarbamoyladenosine(37)-N6)-methyltransferase TrmO [Phycisphaerae bacterium]|nr:tRNA (N6-threonylcarbamoyladenosine(37)-N6)-methyltransferase TrmO [Phycisphaerae bacterium]